MVSLTVRNIPDDIINKIKLLSELDRRSINNEILILLEKGLLHEIISKEHKILNKETQIRLWEKLSGSWEDMRSTKEIIDDIYSKRSTGREITL